MRFPGRADPHPDAMSSVNETSPAPSTERLVKRLAAAVLGLVVIVGLFAAAYLHASTAATQAKRASTTAKAAAKHANQIATCINSILGTRAKPSLATAKEQTKWVSALADVLAAPPAKADAAYVHFKTETQRYKAVLVANQDVQKNNPLGLC